LTTTTQFAFAAESGEAFLFQYLENGGSLTPREHTALDASVMKSILDYYQRARANGNLNESTSLMKSAREVMPLFTSEQTPLAQVRARDYLLERNRLPNALAAPIPTRDGRATALVTGWSFVILAKDAHKQNAAIQYLAWLNDPARLGEWSNAARMIPASKGAFAHAIESPAYADMLWQLLQTAMVAPSLKQQAPYLEAWHQAVTAVLNGQLSPDDAAFSAAQAIAQ
jgi:ABC-type glycerol-3-phosphate transport system substrate-binding protein